MRDSTDAECLPGIDCATARAAVAEMRAAGIRRATARVGWDGPRLTVWGARGKVLYRRPPVADPLLDQVGDNLRVVGYAPGWGFARPEIEAAIVEARGVGGWAIASRRVLRCKPADSFGPWDCAHALVVSDPAGRVAAWVSFSTAYYRSTTGASVFDVLTQSRPHDFRWPSRLIPCGPRKNPLTDGLADGLRLPYVAAKDDPKQAKVVLALALLRAAHAAEFGEAPSERDAALLRIIPRASWPKAPLIAHAPLDLLLADEAMRDLPEIKYAGALLRAAAGFAPQEVIPPLPDPRVGVTVCDVTYEVVV